MTLLQFFEILGLFVILGSLFWFLLRRAKPMPNKQNDDKYPLIEKVCVFWDGVNQADIYEDVRVAHLFKPGLLRLIFNDGHKVYINIAKPNLSEFRVYFKETVEWTLPSNMKLDSLDEMGE